MVPPVAILKKQICDCLVVLLGYSAIQTINHLCSDLGSINRCGGGSLGVLSHGDIEGAWFNSILGGVINDGDSHFCQYQIEEKLKKRE
jgi:hypothetical protein